MLTVTTPTGRRSRRSVDSAVAGEAIRLQSRRTAIKYVLILLLLSLFAWAPLLYPGYLQVHSGFLPVFNLADLAASPNKLRWLPTIGVTPDLLRGEGPLAYWLALLLRPFAGDVGAVKGVFALSILAGGLGVAAWTRRAFARWDEHDRGIIVERSAVLAAMVFMLWPPLLATIYVRGALAEAVLMGLVPWALWGVSSVRCQVSSVKYQVAGGDGFGAVKQTPGVPSDCSGLACHSTDVDAGRIGVVGDGGVGRMGPLAGRTGQVAPYRCRSGTGRHGDWLWTALDPSR